MRECECSCVSLDQWRRKVDIAILDSKFGYQIISNFIIDRARYLSSLGIVCLNKVKYNNPFCFVPDLSLETLLLFSKNECATSCSMHGAQSFNCKPSFMCTDFHLFVISYFNASSSLTITPSSRAGPSWTVPNVASWAAVRAG